MIHPDIVHRQALFDVAVNGKELAEGVGLPPISDEVADMERKDSLKRLIRVNRLAPAIRDHTHFLSAVFIAIQKSSSIQEGLRVPDESWQAANQQLSGMLETTAMSMLSLFVDMGMVHLDPAWEQPSEAQS